MSIRPATASKPLRYFPGSRPNLDLDFRKSKKLDGRITARRATSGTGFVDGKLVIFPVDTARLTDDGLLVEEERTNTLTYSEDLTDASWPLISASVSPSVEISPDGTNTAYKLSFTNDTGSTSALQVNFGTNGVVRTLSIFAKAAETDWLAVGGLQYGGELAWFNLATGTVHQAGGTLNGSWIDPIGNGWYRCSVACDFGSLGGPGATDYGGFLPVTGPGSTASPPSGQGVYVWGAQLEQGSFPTSYIPTDGAEVTRSPDIVSIEGDDFSSWYNLNKGTFHVDVPVLPTGGKFSNVFFSDLGSNATNGFLASGVRLEYIFSTKAAGGMTKVNDVNMGVVNVPVTGTSLGLAYGYQVNNFNAAANKTLGTLDTSGAVPTTLGAQHVFLGSRFNGESNINTSLARWAYYPTRVSDEALEVLTS